MEENTGCFDDWPGEYNELRDLDRSLRCAICYEFLNTAMLAPSCSHNFCSLCIRRYMSYKTQCPTCCKNVSEPELVNNRVLDEITSSFKAIRSHLLQLVKGKLKVGEGHPNSTQPVIKPAESIKNQLPVVKSSNTEEFLKRIAPKIELEFVNTPRKSSVSSASSVLPKKSSNKSDDEDVILCHEEKNGSDKSSHSLATPSGTKRKTFTFLKTMKSPVNSPARGQMTSPPQKMALKPALPSMIQDKNNSSSGTSNQMEMKSPKTQHGTLKNPFNSGSPSNPSTSSVSSPQTSTSTEKVGCPVCGVEIPARNINIHLDRCLSRSEKKESLRSGPTRRKTLPKLIYNIMKDKELKNKLAALKLPTNGDRKTLVKRHYEYTLLYNSECDSLNPKSAEEVASEVMRKEKMKSVMEVTSVAAPKLNLQKGSSSDLVEKVQKEYVKKHKSQFADLIAQARKRLPPKKKKPENEEDNIEKDVTRCDKKEDGKEDGGQDNTALGNTTLNIVPEKRNTDNIDLNTECSGSESSDKSIDKGKVDTKVASIKGYVTSDALDEGASNSSPSIRSGPVTEESSQRPSLIREHGQSYLKEASQKSQKADTLDVVGAENIDPSCHFSEPKDEVSLEVCKNVMEKSKCKGNFASIHHSDQTENKDEKGEKSSKYTTKGSDEPSHMMPIAIKKLVQSKEVLKETVNDLEKLEQGQGQNLIENVDVQNENLKSRSADDMEIQNDRSKLASESSLSSDVLMDISREDSLTSPTFENKPRQAKDKEKSTCLNPVSSSVDFPVNQAESSSGVGIKSVAQTEIDVKSEYFNANTFEAKQVIGDGGGRILKLLRKKAKCKLKKKNRYINACSLALVASRRKHDNLVVDNGDGLNYCETTEKNANIRSKLLKRSKYDVTNKKNGHAQKEKKNLLNKFNSENEPSKVTSIRKVKCVEISGMYNREDCHDNPGDFVKNHSKKKTEFQHKKKIKVTKNSKSILIKNKCFERSECKYSKKMKNNYGDVDFSQCSLKKTAAQKDQTQEINKKERRYKTGKQRHKLKKKSHKKKRRDREKSEAFREKSGMKSEKKCRLTKERYAPFSDQKFIQPSAACSDSDPFDIQDMSLLTQMSNSSGGSDKTVSDVVLSGMSDTGLFPSSGSSQASSPTKLSSTQASSTSKHQSSPRLSDDEFGDFIGASPTFEPPRRSKRKRKSSQIEKNTSSSKSAKKMKIVEDSTVCSRSVIDSIDSDLVEEKVPKKKKEKMKKSKMQEEQTNRRPQRSRKSKDK